MPRGNEPSLVRELCFTLSGKWQPDWLFVIFIGRIDESDTHGPEPDMTMSALLGTARQWELFGRGLRRLQREHGFTILHGTDFRGRSGEFADWPYEKFRPVFDAVGALIENHLTETITATLKYQVYKQHFVDMRPRKMHQTSQYGLLFSGVLDSLVYYVERLGRGNRLSVVVESGHDNAPDTARVFQERHKFFQSKGGDILRSHTLASKADDPLLMAADMAAYGHAKLVRDIRAGNRTDFKDRKPGPAPKPGKIGWTIVEISPEYLGRMIAEFNADKAAAHERYLSRKAAWQASQKKDESS